MQGPVLRLHVGSYASAGGAGLYPLTRRGAGWDLGETYPGACNASFGTYAPRFGLHYLVDEQAEGSVGVYRMGEAGWEILARVATQGAQPCHAALDPGQGWLSVANYGSGSIALFRLDPEAGLPGEATVFGNVGRGPNAERQDRPHAHCTAYSADGRWLYHVDLGTDEILAVALDREGGPQALARPAWSAPPGAGPRQMLLHPHRPLALVLCELSSTLTLLEIAEGSLAARASLSTVPEGFGGRNLGGHLALNAAGDRVYVSNRGHDSIAVFALGPGGNLSPVQHMPSGGASPRFFLLLEEHGLLVAAHEEQGNVTAFAVAADGVLSPLGVVAEVPGAAFLLAETVPSKEPS